MRKLVAIAMIASLVLTMSVTTAYAVACTGAECCAPASTYQCAHACGAGCSMMAGDTTRLSSGCEHGSQRAKDDAVGVQPSFEHAVAVAPAAVPVPVAPRAGLAPASASDARGAPHLTSVIRI